MSELTILHKRLLNPIKRHSSKIFRAMKDWFFFYFDLSSVVSFFRKIWLLDFLQFDRFSRIVLTFDFPGKCRLKRRQIHLIGSNHWITIFLPLIYFLCLILLCVFTNFLITLNNSCSGAVFSSNRILPLIFKLNTSSP